MPTTERYKNKAKYAIVTTPQIAATISIGDDKDMDEPPDLSAGYCVTPIEGRCQGWTATGRMVERPHFGHTGLNFSNRLAAGYLRKQPAGGEGTGGWVLRKVSESTFNRALLVPFAVTSRHFRDVRINQRIDSLPCPALFSMFPGR